MVRVEGWNQLANHFQVLGWGNVVGYDFDFPQKPENSQNGDSFLCESELLPGKAHPAVEVFGNVYLENDLKL